MEEIIKEFEKLGYTHKKSEEFAKDSQLEWPVHEAITDIELAKMFGISLEQFEKEFKDGTIICTAENDKLIRDATLEEQQSVEKYINSISKPTGVNFFDFYD